LTAFRYTTEHAVDSALVVEWRALTVALLDVLSRRVGLPVPALSLVLAPANGPRAWTIAK